MNNQFVAIISPTQTAAKRLAKTHGLKKDEWAMLRPISPATGYIFTDILVDMWNLDLTQKGLIKWLDEEVKTRLRKEVEAQAIEVTEKLWFSSQAKNKKGLRPYDLMLAPGSVVYVGDTINGLTIHAKLAQDFVNKGHAKWVEAGSEQIPPFIVILASSIEQGKQFAKDNHLLNYTYYVQTLDCFKLEGHEIQYVVDPEKLLINNPDLFKTEGIQNQSRHLVKPTQDLPETLRSFMCYYLQPFAVK